MVQVEIFFLNMIENGLGLIWAFVTVLISILNYLSISLPELSHGSEYISFDTDPWTQPIYSPIRVYDNTLGDRSAAKR